MRGEDDSGVKLLQEKKVRVQGKILGKRGRRLCEAYGKHPSESLSLAAEVPRSLTDQCTQIHHKEVRRLYGAEIL